jgi:hypothetical protein
MWILLKWRAERTAARIAVDTYNGWRLQALGRAAIPVQGAISGGAMGRTHWREDTNGSTLDL